MPLLPSELDRILPVVFAEELKDKASFPRTVSNMYKDVEIAREFLAQGYAVAVVKDGTVLGTEKGVGVKPFFKLALRLGPQLAGSSVADRVVGRAVALGAVAYGCTAVYGGLMSEGAVALFRESGVAFDCESLVPQILDGSGSRQCPVERLSEGIHDIEDLLHALERFWGELPATK